MFNAATKTAYTAGAFAVVAGFAAVFSTSDRVAFSTLVFAGVLAVAIGLAGFYFAPRDPVVPVSAEVEAAAVHSIDLGDLPRPSPWPLVGAASVTLLALGAALGKSLVVFGLIAATIATFAWLAQAWREHPSWTDAMTARVNDRFVVPIGLPGSVIVLLGISAVSISRIFLAVSVTAAPIIGIVIAFLLLGAFYLASKREHFGRSMLGGLAAISAVLVLGSGLAGALAGEREFHHAGESHSEEGHGGETKHYELEAADGEFSLAELDLPANTDVVIEFHNEDTVAHTFSVYEDEQAEEVLLEGETVGPGETVEIEWQTPGPGTYYFQSDTDPEAMRGEVIVTEDASLQEENPEEGVNEPVPTSEP